MIRDLGAKSACPAYTKSYIFPASDRIWFVTGRCNLGALPTDLFFFLAVARVGRVCFSRVMGILRKNTVQHDFLLCHPLPPTVGQSSTCSVSPQELEYIYSSSVGSKKNQRLKHVAEKSFPKTSFGVGTPSSLVVEQFRACFVK